MFGYLQPLGCSLDGCVFVVGYRRERRLVCGHSLAHGGFCLYSSAKTAFYTRRISNVARSQVESQGLNTSV
jgi:hypothetical protein